MNKERYLYPEGYYRVKVIGNTMTTSSKGAPYFVLKVEVLERTDKGRKEGIIAGGHRYVNLYTSEKTIDATREFLEESGFWTRATRAEQMSADDAQHVDLSGFEFSARCQHEEYNETVRDKFSLAGRWKLTSPTAWMDNMAPPNRQQIAQLNALFGSSARKYNKPIAASATVSDSDIPW